MDDLSCLIDGFGPVPVRQPRTVAEVGALIREAAAQEMVIYPRGGRTTLGMGLPPAKKGLAVDLCGLDQVIDYPARDMTITVQAGITIARLQEILAPEIQRLPIDVPCAQRATLGGILATNPSGPRRYGYGTLRDYVLGISAVNDDGHEIKAGGRVVKNVAGYDLCKLFIGSLGTLGVITQATLKLRPLPEEQALISLACTADALGSLLDQLHRSSTRPMCLDLLNRPALERVYADAGLPPPDAPWLVVVGYESNAEAVQWQVQQLIKEVHGRSTLEARLGNTAAALWQALVEFPARSSREDGGLTFKANLLPSGTTSFCQQAAVLSDQPLLQAHAGNGVVVGHVRSLAKERAATLLQTLRDLARPFQGRVIVQDCPPAWKEPQLVWGPPPPDVWLMRQVKGKLDPRCLFNPGRFVDGI